MAIVEGLGIEVYPNPLYDAYYGLIDFEFWARREDIGEDAVDSLCKAACFTHSISLLAWLRITEVFLLNGGGFSAPDWSLRVSLANLADEVYEDIGRGVRSGWRVSLPRCV